MTRWEDYPGSIVPYFTNKGKAYLDGIRWEAILEAAQRAVRIENAEIDTLRNPALQDVARLETNPDLSVSNFSEPSGYIMSTNFERTDLDFHELSMRQAISHAIDRQAIVTALLADLGSPLYGPITPADVYYDPAVEEFNQFDLEQAKSMVAELGWTPGDDGILTKNGVRHAFSLVVQAESFNRDLASVLQASLAELGMEVTIEALDLGAYFAKITEGADSSLFYYLWPVPIDVVSLFVGSGTIPAPNWSRAKLPDVDAALEAWKQAANAEELAAAGNQFQLVIAEQLPTIPLVVRNSIWVSRPNVHGWLPHQYDIYPIPTLSPVRALQPGRAGRVVQPRPGIGAASIASRASAWKSRSRRSIAVPYFAKSHRRRADNLALLLHLSARCRSTRSILLSSTGAIPAPKLREPRPTPTSTRPSKHGKQAANAEELAAAGQRVPIGDSRAIADDLRW